jgi:GNAT superfamily N-acetyltransferase
MPSRDGAYTTRELSRRTWGDFEALFGAYNGVQDGCWCMYYHRSRPNRGQPDAARHAQNRSDHQRLVELGEAHGVLVYSGRRAIGWCQFGRVSELPRIDAGLKYRALGQARDPPPDWRITCFFVDRGHRRVGVATLALNAALEAIRRRGGGVIEAYPSLNPRAVATWFGSVSMFDGQGFTKVAPFGRSNVLMRRRLRPSPSRSVTSGGPGQSPTGPQTSSLKRA